MRSVAGSARNRARTGAVSVLAAVLVLGVVGPAHTAEAPEGTGTSSVSIVPAALQITGLPVDVDATLGTLLADATNTGDPVARLALSSIGAAGQEAPTFGVSSADGNQSGSEGRAVGAGGTTATVGLVDYLVEAGADTAASQLSALAAGVTTPTGLGADIGAQGLGATATPIGTASDVVVQITGLELGLGDLLPADVLQALPLDLVLDLVDTLDLPLPADLVQQIADLDALLATLQDAVAAAEDLNEVLDLIDDVPTADDLLAAIAAAQEDVAAAEQEVALLEEEVALLEAQIAELEAQIAELEAEIASLSLTSPLLGALTAELEALEAELAAAEQTLADTEQALVAAEQTLADANTLLDSLRAELEATLDAAGLGDLYDQLVVLEALLDDLLADLDDLLAGIDLDVLLDDLLDALTGTPILGIGSIELVLSSLADGTTSAGTVTCAASGLDVVGVAVPTPDCDAVGTALDTVTKAIGDVLSVLPVTGVVPEMSAGGLERTSSGAGVPDADGVSSAFARVSALTFDVGPADLAGVVDELVTELDGLIGELDALVPGLDVVVPLQLSDSTMQSSALTLPTDLDAALGELQAALGTLPTGGGLEGLSTAGVTAVLGAVETQSTFTAAAAPVSPGTPTAPGEPSTPGTPGTPSAPGNPASPDGPAPITSLPVTGFGLHTLLMAAIAAIAAGGVTAGLGRATSTGLVRVPSLDTSGRRR